MSEYTLENKWELADRRLALLERELDPKTIRLFNDLDIQQGWKCLEIGGGKGSITRWLSKQIGPKGQVHAIDIDTRFLEQINQPNVTIHQNNIATDPLPEESFDLIHSRMVLVHIAERQQILSRLISALKPGGYLVLEEPFVITNVDPSSVFGQGWKQLMNMMEAAGVCTRWAQNLPQYLVEHDLKIEKTETGAITFQGGTASAEFWKISLQQLINRASKLGHDYSMIKKAQFLFNDTNRWFHPLVLVTAIGQK